MSLFDALEHISIEDDSPLSVRDREESKEKNKPDLKKTSNNGRFPAKKQQNIIQPEKLSFLRPCPVCQGRSFTYGKNGGFFCSTCQPGITGSRAFATGKEHSKACTIEPTETQAPLQKVEQEIRNTRQEEDCFKIGFPWIMEHLGELLNTGWTKPELFRRSSHHWCMGNWGLAWLNAWTRPGVIIAIEEKGRISFTFTSGTRTITQAAYPLKMCKKHVEK